MTAPITLPRYAPLHTTPSALAELSYQADRAQKAARAAATVDLDGIPARSARYRPTIDATWLRRIVDRVADDRRAAMLDDDQDMRDAMERALRDDVAARFPAEEMTIVGRHGFGLVCNRIEVVFGLGVGGKTRDYIASVSIDMEPRWLARAPLYLAPVVRDADVRPSHQAALQLPAGALPWFDTVYAVHQERGPRIMAALQWPEKAKKRTGRWPTWGEIFDQYPIIGDWVADQQNPARSASDRGGDPELVMPPRLIPGETTSPEIAAANNRRPFDGAIDQKEQN